MTYEEAEELNLDEVEQDDEVFATDTQKSPKETATKLQ